MSESVVHLRSQYYQQFDADPGLDVPAEGFGGWKSAQLPLDLRHTALVVMHAWDYGPPEDFPGWRRVVEYISRAEQICKSVFPPLLRSVRSSPMPVFHVVSEGDYYQDCPGFERALKLAGPEAPDSLPVEPQSVHRELLRFREQAV